MPTDASAPTREALLKRRVAELEAENRSLRSEIRSGREVTKRALGGSDVQTRLFDESLRATTAAHRSAKKCESARRAFFAARQEVEQLRMAAHDPVAVSDYAAACIDAAEDSETYTMLADSAAGQFRRRPSAASSNAASLLGVSSSSATKPSGGFGWEALRRAMSFNTRHQLEHRLGAPGGAEAALAMPDMESAEAYLKARISRSEHLRQPLEQARAAALATGKEAYGSLATTLGELEYIFSDATKTGGGGLLACPKADFTKASKQLITQIALKLKALRRAVDATCTGILDAEHERVKARRSRLVDGATQLTREDVIFIDNVAKLHRETAAGGGGGGSATMDSQKNAETSAKEWEQRYRALESRCGSLERSLGQQKAAAKTAKEHYLHVVSGEQDKLASMADAVFRLHDAAYRAVHAVFKHRFRWCPACPNHFVDVRRTPSQRRDPATDEVTTLWRTTHVVEIAEASRKDALLLATFAEYFINDNLFGADVLHASRQQSRRGTSIAGPSSSASVRDGFVAFDDPDVAEDKENGGDPSVKPRPKSAAAAPSSARGFRRMEQWHQQQSAKWNERRASASSSAALPPNVKLDDHTPIKAVVGTGAHAATALTPRAVVQTMSLTPTEPALPMPPMSRHGDIDGGASVREPFRRRHSSAF